MRPNHDTILPSMYYPHFLDSWPLFKPPLSSNERYSCPVSIVPLMDVPEDSTKITIAIHRVGANLPSAKMSFCFGPRIRCVLTELSTDYPRGRWSQLANRPLVESPRALSLIVWNDRGTVQIHSASNWLFDRQREKAFRSSRYFDGQTNPTHLTSWPVRCL